MPKISVKLACPKCGFPVSAAIENSHHKFLLFVCPKCQSNVVHYNNKLDIISNKMVKYLVEKNKLQMCGMLQIDMVPKPNHSITSDDVINIKIALGTTETVDDFLKKI
jgi:predicted RNA-binding Zn-ribbon protein involved in translation (DUF1610 family)